MAETLDRISAVMATTARRWLDLAATVPAEVLERPAAAGEWSAVDCLRHLVQADRHVFPARVRQLLAGDEQLVPIDPSAIPPVPEQTAGELAEAFARMREENLGLLASLRPEDLERRGTSRRLGPVTLRDMLHQWTVHDLEHMIQAERALFQAFLVESGPLRAVYAELDQEAGRTGAPAS